MTGNELGYRASRVIDGLSEEPFRDAVVIVEGGKIQGVCGSSEIDPRIEIQDLGDLTLLPGLIDAHVHLVDDGSSQPRFLVENESSGMTLLRSARRSFEILCRGITTVRDMGAPPGTVIALRDAIKAGVLVGCRILSCDAQLTITGGYGNRFNILGREVDGIEAVRKATRETIKAGADFIKLMATGRVFAEGTEPGEEQFTLEEMAVAVQEAHRSKKRVAAHAIGLRGIKNAVDSGVDIIEHGNFLDRETAEMMREKGIFLVPTLIAFYTLANPPEGVSFGRSISKKAQEVWEVTCEAFATARSAGVKSVAGTDGGGPCIPHDSITEELKRMILIGCTNMQAIKAATSLPAEALGIDDRVGAITAGRLADIIAVDGDPMQDITALKRVRLVLKEGEKVPLVDGNFSGFLYPEND